MLDELIITLYVLLFRFLLAVAVTAVLAGPVLCWIILKTLRRK